MNTKIELKYEGQNYTLEYDRAGIKLLESRGFNIDEFIEKPMTNTEMVFQGAFLKNHPNIKLATIDEIFKACPDKTGLMQTLNKMIIRKRTTKTLKASTLINRGVRSTPGCWPALASPLKGSSVLTDTPPLRNGGALFQSACSTSVCQPGVLATFVPSVIERRPLCGLFWWYVCG